MAQFLKDLASRALGLSDMAEPVVTHRFAEFNDPMSGTANLTALNEAPKWAPKTQGSVPLGPLPKKRAAE